MTLTIAYSGETFELTTDHAASSYGQPVCLVNGQVYGPCDHYLPITGDDVFDNLGPGGSLTQMWREIAGVAYRTGIKHELVDRFVALGKAAR